MTSATKGKVEVSNLIDTEYSSGDSNRMTMKQHYQEENNNEVDELSKELEAMGCIVDSVKRPPNICVETCVHEDTDVSGDEDKSKTLTCDEEENAYSDEFEEDNSDNEDQSISNEIKSIKSENANNTFKGDGMKLTKSQSSMSTHRPQMSISGRSTSYG